MDAGGPSRPVRGGGEPGPLAPPAGPTRRETARGLAVELRGAGVESPEVEAERLLAHALGLRRDELVLSGGQPITPSEARRLARAAGRRLAGEPLQHIEGTVDFRGLVLVADPRALIPRPETEELVELAARWARRRARERARAGHSSEEREEERPSRLGGDALVQSALDIGTGSGAIALSLVKEGIAARAIGTDVSARALEQARENRSRLPPELAGRVELRLSPGPVWAPVRPDERFDLIVSNPPYVTESELAELPREVGDHEPCRALAGGPDGLEIVREIVAEARDRLTDDGALFLEIGVEQGATVRSLLEGHGPWHSLIVGRDLSGRERFVVAETGGR